jgi:outer membrane protein TolC
MKAGIFRRLGATVVVAGVVWSASIAAAQTPSASSAAQGPDQNQTLRLTLEDAVRMAVERNPELAITRLDTAVSDAAVAESRGAFVPIFSSTVGRSRAVAPPSNALLGDAGIQVDDLFSTTGVRQRLQWGGGTWSVSWDAARTTTNNPLSAFDPTLLSGFQFAFSQPLVRDRQMDAAKHQYVISRRDRQSSEMRFREAVVQTVAAVKQAYWTLKASIANVTVQERSLELAQELTRQNKVRVEAGENPPIDLVQAQAEVAQRRDNLIRARTTAGDAEDALRKLIMDPSDTSFWRVSLDPVEAPTSVGSSPDVDAAVERGLNERLDVARAKQNVENANTTVEYLSNQRLPDVRLEASYGGSGLGGTQFLRTGFPGVVTGTRSSGYGDALGQLFSSDFPSWSVGVTVSYPIGRSYEAANLARAETERLQAVQKVASLRVQAAESIRQAGRQIRGAAERVEAARAGETLAQERLDTEQRRFEVGLSTTFLVTQAQRDLLQAQVSVLQNMLDYQSALVTFEAVQQAPALTAGSTAGIAGGSVVFLPTADPKGVFRPGASSGFQP